MNTIIISLSSLLVITTLAISTPINAQENNHYVSSEHHGYAEDNGKHKKHIARKLNKMAKYLTLSEEQKVKMKAIFQQAKEERSKHKDEMRGFKEQVRSLLDTVVFDEKSYIELHNQYADQFASAALHKAKTKHAMLQILTEEQRDKFKKSKINRMSLLH